MSYIKYPDTQFLRALAIILITNSHLYNYYPIAEIATGGAIGNAIFFCLSGFGTYLSQQNKNKLFSDWFKDRISRIYPSMWIVLICLKMPILLYSGELNADNMLTFIGQFFNPPHWFIRVLLVYYLLSFFFLKPDQIKKLLSVFGGLAILYAVIYANWVDISVWSVEDHSIKLIHYFMMFLFGIYLASKSSAIVYNGLHNYLILLFLVVIVYYHKFLMAKGLYLEFQFIQQAVMYPLIYYLLKISRSPFISSILSKSKVASSTVQFVSSHTLELYIVQETTISTISQLKFPFPWNAITFICLTFVFSAIVSRLASLIRTKVR